MKRLKISTFVLALVACTPLVAFAQGAAGEWEVTLQTPQGANVVNIKLAQTGNALTGTLSSMLGEVPMKGTATGADIAVTADIDAGGMTLSLAFTGKVAGDTLNGSVKMGDFGEATFTGKRMGAKPAAPAAVAAPAASSAAGGNISGKWDVVLSIPGVGDIPLTATMVQSADKVAGMIDSQVGGNVAVTGTLTGNALKLSFTAATQNGDIPVELTGTLAAGALSGKASIAGLGEADWTGKRAK
jgi:hypothetical protein